MTGWRVGAGILALLGGLALMALLGPQATPSMRPTPAVAGPRPGSEGRVRVEVLNAGDVSGQAAAATAALRDSGFDVVFFGNAAEEVEDSSRVIARAGDVDLAAAVANALGIPNVLSEPDSNLFVDVSVMLGSDWRLPEEVVVAVPGVRPWWDPRTWFR